MHNPDSVRRGPFETGIVALRQVKEYRELKKQNKHGNHLLCMETERPWSNPFHSVTQIPIDVGWNFS